MGHDFHGTGRPNNIFHPDFFLLALNFNHHGSHAFHSLHWESNDFSSLCNFLPGKNSINILSSTTQNAIKCVLYFSLAAAGPCVPSSVDTENPAECFVRSWYHGCCWCFPMFICTCNLYGPCVVIWMNMSAVQEGWHGDTGVTGTLLPFWFQGWNKNTVHTVSVDYMCCAQAGTLRRNS